ncbi:MAG TPA: hypothetical protein VN450_08105 [Candidatus Methylomirabilis sp.]|nr:hypothetical protein [Candidatus Methylomirabilis sp.]
MKRNAIVVAFIIAVLSTAGVAESADNTTGTSYFEGVWSGAWDPGGAQYTGQDVTITIGNRNEKGAHKTTYAWGWGKSISGGSLAPGSIVVYGRERDGVFSFGWKDKEGLKRTVTMEKYKEDAVKAKIEREGPVAPGQQPYYNAILKRK